MNMTIQGISVTADPALPRQKTVKIVSKLIKDWAWEGKQLGKIEIICEGTGIRISSYEQPVIQIVPHT